jgi:hypothetical protein
MLLHPLQLLSASYPYHQSYEHSLGLCHSLVRLVWKHFCETLRESALAHRKVGNWKRGKEGLLGEGLEKSTLKRTTESRDIGEVELGCGAVG